MWFCSYFPTATPKITALKCNDLEPSSIFLVLWKAAKGLWNSCSFTEIMFKPKFSGLLFTSCLVLSKSFSSSVEWVLGTLLYLTGLRLNETFHGEWLSLGWLLSCNSKDQLGWNGTPFNGILQKHLSHVKQDWLQFTGFLHTYLIS